MEIGEETTKIAIIKWKKTLKECLRNHYQAVGPRAHLRLLVDLCTEVERRTEIETDKYSGDVKKTGWDMGGSYDAN